MQNGYLWGIYQDNQRSKASNIATMNNTITYFSLSVATMSFISKSFLILTDFFTPHLHCICQPDTTNFLNAKHSYCMCVRLTWDFLKKVYPPPPPHHPVRQWQMVISSDRITLERVQQESKVKGDAISLGNFTIISLIRDSSIWPKKTNFPVELDNIETFYCFNGQKVIELWGGGGGGLMGKRGKM